MFKNETAATHSGMIDIHAHILPGFDDGAKSLSDAMIMAEMAEESGVNAIVATPHVHSSGGVRLEMVEAGVETLRQKLLAAGTEIAVFPGMEIMADDAAPSLLAKGKLGTLNASRYPLLEFAFSEQPERMTRLLMRTEPFWTNGRKGGTLCADAAEHAVHTCDCKRCTRPRRTDGIAL